MDRRLPVDAPGLVAAMIDPLLIAMALDVPVRQCAHCSRQTPSCSLLFRLRSRVRAKPSGPFPSGRIVTDHMDVEVPLIAVLVRRVKSDVDHIPLPDKLLAGKSPWPAIHAAP